ncbi:hypothetical protein GJ496_009251 [Pomphorhynchus laevis]|nr:hypothetical protein GJ496_009251 [Pomphorhynchus laevis]
MNCRILCHISIKNTFITHKDHNNNSEKSKVIKKQLLRTVVTESTKSGRPTLEIITKNTSVLDDEPDKYGKKNLTYITSNEELDDIPELLKNDFNGNPFVRYDNRSQTRRIIIMFSEFAAEYFTDAEVILVDGTFWSVPGQFYQLCTFKVKVFGNLVPHVYILLPNKAEATYLEAFTILKTLLNISVSYIITDFEMGLINALKASFESTMGGCTFHLVHPHELKNYTQNPSRHLNRQTPVQTECLGDNIVKISNIKLTDFQHSILSRGLSFVPTPVEFNCYNFTQNLRKIGCVAADEKTMKDYNLTSTITKAILSIAVIKMYIDVLPRYKGIRIITVDQFKVIKEVGNDESIEVKPADKGGKIVVWNTADYINEG